MSKKKIFKTFVLASCLIVPSMLMLSACGHKHTYNSNWTKNETYHWHEATCKHSDNKGNYAEHTFGDWTVKTPAGLHQNRVDTRKCSVCEFEEEKVIENTETHTFATTWSKDENQHWKESTCEGHTQTLKNEIAEHTFGAWEIKTPAGLHQNRVDTRKCSVCKFEEEKVIENTETHTFATTWSKDENQHWKESTCEGHTPALKSEVADHTFGAWETKTPADYGVNKVEKHTCEVCGFEDEREVENSALQPQTNNISVATINLKYSGNKQSIDSFVTADNSTGMVIKYKGTGDTTYAESTTAPTNAGTYEYTITIPATTEWAKGEKTGNFEIKKYQVACPDIFVTELSQGQEKTTKLCEIDLTDKDDINLDEVELIYSSSNNPNGIGASRMDVYSSSVKIAPAYENNIEVVIPSNKQTIEWIVLDGNDAFSLLCTDPITPGSCYKGTIRHGFVKVGDKLTVLDYNSSTNRLFKVGVTITQIEYKEKYADNYHETTYATKDEIVKITFTKDNDSDNISSVSYIVSAQDIGEVNQNAGFKSKTIDLSLTGNEFRMLKLKVNSSSKCTLSVSNADNCKLLKVFNATTGEEITLSSGNFQVAEGTEVYIIIQQDTTSGTQQVKAELVEYTFGA